MFYRAFEIINRNAGPCVVVRTDPPSAVIAVGFPDYVLTILILESDVYFFSKSGPPLPRPHLRNTWDAPQAPSEGPTEKFSMNLEGKDDTGVVRDWECAETWEATPMEVP
jgi:hypothetical protein